MKYFVYIHNNKVVNRAVFGDTGLPQNWPDAENWYESEEAQIGWEFDGVNFNEPVISLTIQQLKDYTSEKRKTIINGAGSFDTGEKIIPVWVDSESRGSLTGLVVASQMDPNIEVLWKSADGEFYTLDATEIVTVSIAVMTYIQTAFTVEANIKTLIEAETITTYEQIDAIEQWPEPYEV